jgi:hypothetical protein
MGLATLIVIFLGFISLGVASILGHKNYSGFNKSYWRGAIVFWCAVLGRFLIGIGAVMLLTLLMVVLVSL